MVYQGYYKENYNLYKEDSNWVYTLFNTMLNQIDLSLKISLAVKKSMIGKEHPKGMLGKKHSNETKIKISNFNKGRVSCMYGKTHSLKTKQKMSESSKGRVFSNIHRKRLSISGKGGVFSIEHRKKISEKSKLRVGSKNPFYGKTHSIDNKLKISDSRFKYMRNNKGLFISKLDKHFESLLKFNNIDYEPQKVIERCSIDFFLSPNICIFCDGDYWHNLDSHKKRDFYVNNKLRENGFLVLRFWEHEIHENSDKCIDKIKRSVCWYE